MPAPPFVAIRDQARYGTDAAKPKPSQRDLVAWSLLRCPDDRPHGDRR
jgi:hypothetical protein